MKWLICLLFGHKWFVEKEFTPDTRKVGCHRCGKRWGMNDRLGILVQWDDELEDFYAIDGVFAAVTRRWLSEQSSDRNKA